MTPDSLREKARAVANELAYQCPTLNESEEIIAAAMKEVAEEAGKEAMSAGYAQGVEATEARSVKRITELEKRNHQLEALDPIRALLDEGKVALIESLKADVTAAQVKIKELEDHIKFRNAQDFHSLSELQARIAEEKAIVQAQFIRLQASEASLAAALARLAGQDSEILSLKSALNIFEDEVKSIAGSVNGRWREVVTGMQERIRHLEALVALPCPKDHDARLAEAESRLHLPGSICGWEPAFEVERELRVAAEAKLAAMTKERDALKSELALLPTNHVDYTEQIATLTAALVRVKASIVKIQAHIEAGPAHIELTHATVECSDALRALPPLPADAKGEKA